MEPSSADEMGGGNQYKLPGPSDLEVGPEPDYIANVSFWKCQYMSI
jgi:hypothetical protein